MSIVAGHSLGQFLALHLFFSPELFIQLMLIEQLPHKPDV